MDIPDNNYDEKTQARLQLIINALQTKMFQSVAKGIGAEWNPTLGKTGGDKIEPNEKPEKKAFIKWKNTVKERAKARSRIKPSRDEDAYTSQDSSRYETSSLPLIPAKTNMVQEEDSRKQSTKDMLEESLRSNASTFIATNPSMPNLAPSASMLKRLLSNEERDNARSQKHSFEFGLSRRTVLATLRGIQHTQDIKDKKSKQGDPDDSESDKEGK